MTCRSVDDQDGRLETDTRHRLQPAPLVGLWLSLNVLSFQTSLETWTTAAIINWSRAAESVQVEEEYVWKLTQDIDFSQLHY